MIAKVSQLKPFHFLFDCKYSKENLVVTKTRTQIVKVESKDYDHLTTDKLWTLKQTINFIPFGHSEIFKPGKGDGVPSGPTSNPGEPFDWKFRLNFNNNLWRVSSPRTQKNFFDFHVWQVETPITFWKKFQLMTFSDEDCFQKILEHHWQKINRSKLSLKLRVIM